MWEIRSFFVVFFFFLSTQIKNESHLLPADDTQLLMVGGGGQRPGRTADVGGDVEREAARKNRVRLQEREEHLES